MAPARPGPRPSVLFVCVHNAGRSQMGAALLDELGAGRIDVRSCGSEPADQINAAVAAAMSERGIDLASSVPRRISDELLETSDVVITMGCGDACPIYPGKRYEDWELDDPAGQDIEAVREIRDEIEVRVRELLDDLLEAP